MADTPEPLSWLTLERYALGELSAAERAEVEARLAASPADRACLAEIRADQSVLPPLRGQAVTPAKLRPTAERARRARWLGLSAALCAAAAALIVVVRAPERTTDALPQEGIKGSEVTLKLWSERQGADPQTFQAGERFKLAVTCPPRLARALRLFVLQGEELFEPLPRAPDFACGNLVPWPGAFALDGSAPADVCMYWGPAARPNRDDLSRDARCSRLEAR